MTGVQTCALPISFTPLPQTGGLLFLIRVAVHPLLALVSEPDGARDLLRMLSTMPGEIANYKGLAAARPGLMRQLEGLARPA